MATLGCLGASCSHFLYVSRHGPISSSSNVLVRIVSGVLVSLYPTNNTNVGVIAAADVFISVGIVPMLLCDIGFLRLIHAVDFASDQGLKTKILRLRFGFLIAAVLLVAGGALLSQSPSPSSIQTGADLSKAAYVVLAAVLALVIGFESYFWTRYRDLSRTSRITLIGISATMPFQVVRLAYGLAGEFSSSAGVTLNRWNLLDGDIGLFVGMALVMELCVAFIFLAIGYTIDPMPKKSGRDRGASET